MTKETFIQTMELLQKQPNYESDLARELLNTLKHAFPDVYDWFYGGLRGRITMQFGQLTKRSTKIWAMLHLSTTLSQPQRLVTARCRAMI